MRRAYIAIALLLAPLAAAQQFTDPDRRAKLRTALPEISRIFDDFATQRHVPGFAIGVIIDEEVVESYFGLREIDTKARVNSTTVFRIASMTKSFTALSILKLRDEGKLSLDDPAEKYVPELRTLAYPTKDSPRLTVRHLLSHSEGFPEDNPWGDQQLARTEEHMTEMLRRGIPFSNPPGIAYEYSNYGFAILGRIVSRVSGMSYADYVSANILKPLALTATTLEAKSVPPDRLAHGYRWEDNQWKEEPQLPHGAFGAMGGMLTSIDDLARYVRFHMSAWPPRDDPDTGPVKRASLREMQQPWRSQRAAARSDAGNVAISVSSYAFGLGVRQTCDFGNIVSHSGGLPGFGSQMLWLPEYGVGLIALGNLTYTGWGAVMNRALDELRKTGGLKPRVPQPSPALLDAQKSVSRLIANWDDRLADEIAADNLYLDTSKDRRRRAIDELRSKVGTCRAEGTLEPENALRGRWRMPCERGQLEVSITLAPTMPPRVQYLAVRSVDPAADTAPKNACGQ